MRQGSTVAEYGDGRGGLVESIAARFAVQDAVRSAVLSILIAQERFGRRRVFVKAFRPCSQPGCPMAQHALGLCRRHYRAERRKRLRQLRTTQVRE